MKPIYAERIREIRQRQKKTQTEFAIEIGTTKNQLSKYETGAQEIPTKIIVKVCGNYNVDANWLLGVDEKAVVVKGASITKRDTEALKAVVKVDEKALAVKGALPKADKPSRAVKAGKIIKGKV